MLQNEKTAIFRIAFDLIKADEIIENDELKTLDAIEKDYCITDRSIWVKSQQLSFSDAVKQLATLPQSDIDKLIKRFDSLTLADGSCTPSEAILLMALRCCLLKKYRKNCVVMRSNSLGAKVAPLTVLFVEGESNRKINSIISENYREIANEFRLAGFDFIYIPKVSEKFNSLESNFLQSVITNLAPTLSDEDTDKIYHNLCNLTTSEFCRQVLLNKLAITGDAITSPALLIKIGESTIIENQGEHSEEDDEIEVTKTVPEYLKLELSEHLVSEIRQFIDVYKRLLSADQVLLSRPKDSGWFMYSGFYKTFFDMLAYPGRRVESRIVIDLIKRKLLMPDIDEDIKLPAQRRTIYTLMLLAAALKKEVDITDSRVAKAMQILYEKIGKDDADFGEIKKNLSQNISKIKEEIHRIKLLKNRKKYLIERRNDILSLNVDADKIYIMEDGKKEIPLSEYEKWMNII